MSWDEEINKEGKVARDMLAFSCGKEGREGDRREMDWVRTKQGKGGRLKDRSERKHKRQQRETKLGRRKKTK